MQETEAKGERFSHANGEHIVTLGIPMPDTLRQQIDNIARERQISRAAVARQLIVAGLARPVAIEVKP